ncbi:MAG: YggS family pyridoxal phosphate-dependent enzyme [Alphaproteobacteria bacterium]|nr:YggS family pyridoxal phosphate-dependent enzyme [Alphaproteobacteria bacterium]
MPLFPRNLQTIRQRISDAARKAERNPNSIKLVAVSKAKDEADIRAALDAGHKVFGENRVQEAQAKYPALRAAHPDLKLHMIGSLQTNKAEDAVQLFDVIETLDRPRLAAALSEAIKKTGRNPECYIEVNIGGELQKSGIAPEMLGDFLGFCRDSCGLNVTGLMALPPQHADPMPFFQQMKQLADTHKLPHLSLGMSGDFEAAIACGATEVRIGTALFGPR